MSGCRIASSMGRETTTYKGLFPTSGYGTRLSPTARFCDRPRIILPATENHEEVPLAELADRPRFRDDRNANGDQRRTLLSRPWLPACCRVSGGFGPPGA